MSAFPRAPAAPGAALGPAPPAPQTTPKRPAFRVKRQIQVGTIDPECFQIYHSMSSYQSNILYAIFTLSADESRIIVETTRTASTTSDASDTLGTFDTFHTHLAQSPNDPKWALFNFSYKTRAGAPRRKLLFVTWAPDSLKRGSLRDTIRMKTCAILVTGKFREGFEGGGGGRFGRGGSTVGFLQANEPGDVRRSCVVEVIRRYEPEDIDYRSVGLA